MLEFVCWVAEFLFDFGVDLAVAQIMTAGSEKQMMGREEPGSGIGTV